MYDAVVCQHIFPDEKEMLADTKNGFLSIYSENKKLKKSKKKSK